MLRLILGLLVGFVSDSNAGVGDTYYCVTKYSSGILRDKLVNFEPEKFTFQWKKDQIVFGKGSHWEGVSMKVASRYGSAEEFRAEDLFSTIYFVEGRFRYASVSNHNPEVALYPLSEVKFEVADCSKF